jgi:tRNA(Ile)-lysidine synthetase-like protein
MVIISSHCYHYLMNQKSVYIVAVSGGVDSVVLLHKLYIRLQEVMKDQSPDSYTTRYIVAHFNHGIRTDSYKDAAFVAKLAKTYRMDFELGEGHLGAGASEAVARHARYAYLRSLKEKYQAEKIITAHHQDDVLETMVINIIRGTGPRGLHPMNGQADILRPLLHRTKKELLSYASEHALSWREDSTNMDEKYLRNYVRLHIMPELASVREKLLVMNERIGECYSEIDMRIKILLPKHNVMSRHWFVGLSYSLQKELIRAWLLRCGVDSLDSLLIERVTVAAKTLPVGKKTDISGKLWLLSEKHNILITSK